MLVGSMGKYDNISDGVLKLIIEEVNNSFDDNGVDFDDLNFIEVAESISDVISYFGVDFDASSLSDVSYFYELCRINPNYNDEPIKRPELKKYEVEWDENVTVYKTVTISQTIESFMELDKNIVRDLEDEGVIDYTDGRILYEREWDGDTTSVELESVREI